MECLVPVDDVSHYVLWVLRRDEVLHDPPSLGEWKRGELWRQ